MSRADRTSPVRSSMTVTPVMSVIARISLPRWAALMPRWCMRPARRMLGRPGRGGALHCPVRAVLVVVLAEGAGLALQVSRVAAVAGGISWQTLRATDGVRTRLADPDRRSPAPTIRRVSLCTFVNSFLTVALTGSTLFALVTFTRAEYYYYSRCHEIAEQ